MTLELRSFRTKVARRIFGLFAVCVLLPVLVLAWISFRHVSRQIRAQSASRLSQDTKAVGNSIFERLVLASAEMKLAGASARGRGDRPLAVLPKRLAEKLPERLTSLELRTDSGDRIRVFGAGEIPWELTPGELEHIRAEKTLLRYRQKPNHPQAIYLYAALEPEAPLRGMVAAEVNNAFLWQVAAGRPGGTEVYVWDQRDGILFGSVPDRQGIERELARTPDSRHAGFLEWRDDREGYVAAYRAVFLKPTFLCADWIVVLRQASDDAFAPFTEFKTVFLLVGGVFLGAVALLSVSLIRKNTAPVEILQEATRRIGDGSCGYQVNLQSGDEFEILGRAFNTMSHRLQEGQALLLRAAKLSTMGQMAAGVVHEIKQPLTAMSGLLQLALLDERAPQKRKNLETALGAAGRLDAILERFRSFSRTSGSAMEPVALGQVVSQIVALMEHQFRMTGIRCSVQAEDNLSLVRGDQQELHQVFSNLIVNAMQAMEGQAASRRTLGLTLCSAGDKVLAHIEDTGCGMSREVVERMFDPFFTTKDPARGTGLGMAIVASILHKHGATIEVHSEVGVGTRITLVFQAVPPEDARSH